MQRTELRVEAILKYGVITALMMSTAIGIYANTPQVIQTGKRVHNGAIYLFKTFTCLTVISGTYVTVLFTLLGIYSKTALGSGLDAEFASFFQETRRMRQFGFNSFLVSLASFMVSFLISVFLDTHGQFRMVLLIPATALVVASAFSVAHVIQLATNSIFSKKEA